jgi:membrane-associated phospholipid phosphatase
MTKEVQHPESESSKHAGRPAPSSFATFHSALQRYTFVDYATQGYIFTPVVGPRILCPGIVAQPLPADVTPASPLTTPAAVQAGVFFQIMAWLYRFEIPGAAFPSSHVAVALCTVYFSFLYLRPIRWAHLLMATLLCISTVYGRYHYVVDVVAGVLTAAMLIPLGNRLYFKFQGPNDKGNHLYVKARRACIRWLSVVSLSEISGSPMTLS